MREVFFAWRASAYIHVVVLGSLYYVSSTLWQDFVPPQAFTTVEGRAAVELTASIASLKELDPDKESEVIIESAPREPVEAPELKPTKLEIQKQESEAPAPRLKELPDVEATELAAVTPVEIPTEKPETKETPETKSELTAKPIPREPPKPVTEHAKEYAEVTAPASVSSRAIEGTDIDQPPQMMVNPTPPFPDGAIAAGRQGVVWLLVNVSPKGTVAAVSVRTSSGYSDLDQSALTTIKRWRFRPATKQGFSVPCDVVVPIRFTIR